MKEINHFFEVTPCDEGGYFIRFPELPGCMTQVETIAEIPDMAYDIESLWMESQFDEYKPSDVIKLPIRARRELLAKQVNEERLAELLRRQEKAQYTPPEER